ncbi:MAG: ABC transporter permease [Halanaerobiales bacterium]
MMNDTLKVAKWEFLKGIKNKAFLFITFVLPILMVIIMAVVGYFSAQGMDGSDLKLGIIDNTDFMTESLKSSFAEEDFEAEFISLQNTDELKRTLEEEGYDGILNIPVDVLDTNLVSYYYKDLSGLETDFVRDILTDIIVNKRLVESGYSPDEISDLTSSIRIDTRSLKDEEGEDAGVTKMLLPFGLAFLMIFGIIMSGSILMQSIIKEKTNRIVEIVLSSISAKTLMAGKILGYALLSLVQIGIWLSAGVLVLLYFQPAALTGILEPKTLLMLVYFAFGFLIVTCINAIVASTMKDAQTGGQSSGLFVIIPIIPLYFSMPIMNSPTGIISRVLTYIPVFTPTTMMLRLGVSTPPVWEIIATIVVLLVACYLLVLLSSKVFRIGMLMYGKTPDLKEIIKWARSKDY